MCWIISSEYYCFLMLFTYVYFANSMNMKRLCVLVGGLVTHILSLTSTDHWLNEQGSQHNDRNTSAVKEKKGKCFDLLALPQWICTLAFLPKLQPPIDHNTTTLQHPTLHQYNTTTMKHCKIYPIDHNTTPHSSIAMCWVVYIIYTMSYMH